MAQPMRMEHEHYVERDTGTGAGVWAVVAVLIVLLALLLFGSNLFGRSANPGGGAGTDIDVRGDINTNPSGGTGGAGTTPAQ
ncbi:MAG TPA: hypothetical protein VEC17_00620 [Candidatus Binatia bacterium]|nr:hypothetical protein [Candidatus Binatia bacterium]